MSPDLDAPAVVIAHGAWVDGTGWREVDRVTAAAWHTKPSWYAVTEEDRVISPAVQREIAARIRASVCSLRASHVPFLSKPKETADVILAAVDLVSAKRPRR